MSHMHDVYVGAKMFYEDEGHFPATLLGYVETPDTRPVPPGKAAHPANRPALGCAPGGSSTCSPLTTDVNLTSMEQETGTFTPNVGMPFEGVNRVSGYDE